MSANAENWLTLAEARERLRVSRSTLFRFIHEQGLKQVCCGGIRRIAESELRRWAAEHTSGANEENAL